jgi:hypothetical protein
MRMEEVRCLKTGTRYNELALVFPARSIWNGTATGKTE